MAFFDRSKIYPAPYNRIKLQEFDNNNQNTLQHGRDGSGAYAVNKGAVLCFLCDYKFEDLDNATSNRLISFKGFVEDLQIDLSIEYKDIELFRMPVVPKIATDYGLSYNLTFNVIAHSVNDAMSNMARFSELDRILHYPEMSDGVSNTGSPTPSNHSPESYIFLSNLIGNGLLAADIEFTNINITNYFVRKYGLRAPVADLKMDPDLEMGFFEYNNKFYFKSFKISLNFPVTNANIHKSHAYARRFVRATDKNKIQRWKTIIPFVKKNIQPAEGKEYTFYDFKEQAAKGSYPENVWDSKGFPFCIPFDSNIIKNDYGAHLGHYPKQKRAKIGICINSSEISRTDNPYIYRNYLNFNAFVESYSFSRKQKVDITQPIGDLILQKHTFGGNSQVFFNLSFNAVAGSINEAKANAMKLTSLYRMVILNYKGEFPSGSVKILFANLIKNPQKSNSNGNYDFSDIYDNGMSCFIINLNVQIDQEMGYFEENKYFIPKAYKITMELVFNKSTTGLLYLENEEGVTTLQNSETDSTYWPFGVGYERE